jgi:hypothetical protein
LLVVFTLGIEVSKDTRMPAGPDRPEWKVVRLGVDSDEHHEVRIDARI